jgi:hypothetical protein
VTSTLSTQGERITLSQQFREADFYDSSAIAIAVIGRASRARYLNQSTVQLSVEPARGHFTILVGSAASANPSEDTAVKKKEPAGISPSRPFSVLALALCL